MSDYFYDVDYYQLRKHNQNSHGDAFLSKKIGNRVVSVLADGLGSGIKANVLATLTTTMALKFITADMDIRRAAEVILETLPVCSYRKIGYSTFTIVDAKADGSVRIIEHDNPQYVWIRDGQIINADKRELLLETTRKNRLLFSEIQLEPGDRIIVYSDGVSQAGIGQKSMPLGWLEEGVEEFLLERIKANPSISAGDISKQTVLQARDVDRGKEADDITCATIYLRKPRKTLLMTGPPYKQEHDKILAEIAKNFDGAKIICGGTTAEIIARELNQKILLNIKEALMGDDVPPTATMPGFDLITEGTITLSKCLKVMREGYSIENLENNAVKKLLKLLLDSDIITCIVGTKINNAHQDPNLPKELEIRRNLMKQFCELLETKYLKETRIKFI